MLPIAFDSEQEWLREFAQFAGGDYEFSALAQVQMRHLDLTVMDVIEALCTANLVLCERDHVGCVFIAQGRSIDDEVLEVRGRFHVDRISVAVESLNRME